MPKHSNTIYQRCQSFIKKSKIVHNDKFDYSLVDYFNTRTKVSIICPVHGIFHQIPQSHVSGSGCKKCQDMSLTITTEEFVERSHKIHKNKYDYTRTKYINAHAKVTITCPIHGDFEQIAADHINGYWCNISQCRKGSHSTETFTGSAIKVHGNKYGYT